MAQDSTAVLDAWLKDFTDGALDPQAYRPQARQPKAASGASGGAGVPDADPGGSASAGAAAPGGLGGAAGGKAKPPVFHPAVFSDHAGTMKIMQTCDIIHRAGAIQVKIGKDLHKVAEVFAPVTASITKAADLIARMNRDSSKEADSLVADEHGYAWVAAKWAGISAAKTSAEVHNEAKMSESYLAAARRSVAIPAFADAYEWLLKGINAGFRARSAVGVYDEKLVHGAEGVVSALEIARDGSFAALGILSGVAEVGIVVEVGIALLPAAAEVYGKIVLDEKVNWANFGAELLLTVVASKFKVPFAEKMEGACKPLVLKLLPKTIGKLKLTPAQEEAVIKYVAEKVQEMAKSALVALAGSFCAEKKKESKPLTYKEMAMEFIHKVTSAEFIEKFIGTMVLTQALSKAGVKLDAVNKAKAPAA